MIKKLLLLLAVILFSFDAISQCTITGTVNASTLNCASYGSCSTIYIGDGSTNTTLTMNADLDLTCLGSIQFIVRNNATINYTSNVNLSLPAGSSFVVENGGNITAASCNGSKAIWVGIIRVASCDGTLALNNFSGLISNGGYNVVTATAPSICGSGTSTLTATRVPSNSSTTYTWYDASNNTVSTSSTYTTPVISTTTTYYVEATTAGFITTPRKAVTVVVNPIPAQPTVTVTQPTCSIATGTITITAPTAAGMTYSIDGSTYTNTTGIFSTVTPGTYNVTAKSAAGCISPANSITVNPQPVTPVKPTLSSAIQPTCVTATGSFTISNYNAAYTYAVSPSTGVIISGSTVTAPPATYTVTATLGVCTSPASSTITINPQPTTLAKPTLGSLIQPICSTGTGSVTITNYNATYTYTVSPSAGVSISGNTITAPPATYTVTASLGSCTSLASSSVTLSTPSAPAKPTLSTATHPTCSTATGSFTITNYDPTYTYAVSPSAGVSISGNTVTAPGGDYTVTATLGTCTSLPSLNRTINAQPTPPQPTLSTATHPTCSTPTGSFTITNYNGSYAYTVSPSTGVGISANTITAPAGTYTVTATSAGCSSIASLSVTVNAQPVTPTKPILSAAIHPTCTIPTGSFTITNYDASYTYAVSPSTGVTISGNTIIGPAGAYTVTATLGSCTSPVSLVRNISAIPATPATPIVTANQPNCLSATGTITITTPVAIGMTYSIDGTTYTNSTGVFSDLAPGTYSVTAKSDVGCISSATNVTISPVNTNTWNGSAWSTGSIPTGAEMIIFNGNFSSTTDLAGCSCQVNSGTVVINPGHNLTITNGISVLGGSLTFEDSANLVQVNDNAVNTGNIIYKRKTTPLKQYDYAYWSAPVANATLSQLATNSLLYAYSPSINNWVQQFGSTTMVIGQGYIGRAPNNLTYATPQIVETSFTGVPNNGALTTPITKGAGVLNLIGNPYPSAIDIDQFINDPANSGIVNGTIYLWTHNTAISSSNPGNNTYNYTANDYAKYNITGGVKTASAALTGGVTPTGKIAAGQGFFIDANSALANGTYSATFKNSMRISGNNTQFFRTSEAANTNNSTAGSLEKHRVWLSLSNNEGAYNEALVGYIQGATNEIDRLFDGKTLPAENVVSVYSLSSNEKLSIQGRSLPFSASDIVPIGYTTTLSGDFSIRLENFDGLFANQDIYLLDKTTGLYHDLKVGAFTFTTTNGTFNNRFELRYTTATLSVSTVNNNSTDIRIITGKQHLSVLSGASSIASIEVHDLLGKLIYAKKDIHTNEFHTDAIPAGSQMLIIKVTLDDNKNVTKKVLMP